MNTMKHSTEALRLTVVKTSQRNHLVKMIFTRQEPPLQPLWKIWGHIPLEQSSAFLYFQWLTSTGGYHSNVAGTGWWKWHSFIGCHVTMLYVVGRVHWWRMPLLLWSFPTSKHRQGSWTPYGLFRT